MINTVDQFTISKKDLKVLVVDDDEQIIKLIKLILKKEGINTVSATTIEGASEKIDSEDVHLLIIDYYLEESTGLDVIQKLKKKKPTIPVIMMSGAPQDATESLKFSSLEHGANIFLEKPLNGLELRHIIKNMLNLYLAYEDLEEVQDIVFALGKAIEARDPYTDGHSQRVSKYSTMLYDSLGFNDEVERADMQKGCLLHDIGKIGVPDDILKSNRKLTSEEFEMIKQHPVSGYNICKDLKRLQKSLSVIRSHHEKLDGSGYPDGLQGDDIPTVVQIVTIADIYDALTSKRAYRSDHSVTAAIEIMDREADEGKINSVFFGLFKKLIEQKA